MTPFDPRLPIIATEARVKTCHVFHCWHALREMGRKFHTAAYAMFAGLEEKHVAAILTALEAHNALPEGRARPTAIASRLPQDWEAPKAWLDWACAERHWHPVDAAAEADSFANFWIAKSGKDATKLDWERTWHNWVRNSRRPNGTYSAAPTISPQEFRAQQERMADLYDRMGRTTEADEIRKRIPRDNVVPMRRDTPESGEKLAFL